MTHLLVVEDEDRVADFIERGLRAEGYRVSRARSGREALALAGTESFSVVLLDLLLPGMPGIEVCRRLRAEGDLTPVLMLTAVDAVEDKVAGLRQGADDYLTKPFAFDELLARIEALIRRHRPVDARPQRLEIGDLVLDREALTVARAGRPVELTAKELALLELLMAAPGRVFSRARILNAVWDTIADPLTNVVDVYIRRLRMKLDDDGSVIITVRGHGYKIGAAPGRD